MAGEDINSLELLGKYRGLDQKDADGNVSPDNQTLDPLRVYEYLDTHGFNKQNFEQRFNFSTALDLIAGQQAADSFVWESLLQSRRSVWTS